MSKRILLFGGVLFLALLVIIGFIILQRRSTSLSNPLKAIPVDASLVLQINNFHNLENMLFEKNQVFTSLEDLSPFRELNDDIHNIDSLAMKSSELTDLLYHSTVYISGHFIGGRRSEFLFIIQKSMAENIRQDIEILARLAGQDIKGTERKYEGKSIYTIKIKKQDTERILYLGEIEGNLLISRSVILIENAIRQYSLPKSLLDNEEFTAIISTAGKSKDANIYVDLGSFPAMLSVLSNDKLSARMKAYHQFGGWMELDLNVTEKQIMLNGFIGDSHNETDFNDLFKNNTPINITADKILPAAISSFISLGGEDFKILHEQYVKYLNAIGKNELRKNRLLEFEKKYNVSIEHEMLAMIDREITVARGRLNSRQSGDPSMFVLVKCKSGTQGGKKLLSMIEKIQATKGKSSEGLKYSYTIDTDTHYQIVKIPADDLTGLLFGELFSMNESSYFTVLGNYLIFGNSREALGEFIYSNVLSKTLSTNEAYKTFNSSIAQKSYFLFYTNLARSSSALSEYLHPEIIRTWEDNFDIFQKIQPFGFQITEVSGMNYTNISVQYLDDIKGKPQTIWESLLDTTFTFKPQLVENHYTKQNEIFLQDDGNTIYLINKAGRVLWKQNLPEAINSKVYQIDYYKNGKLQLLFSTKNYLHLIDRNGNYVERYPIRLREESSAGMSLFDYENNRNYRILIPCINNQVYAYTKDGSLINGWQFAGSETEVRTSLEHFRIEEKDFIVFADRNRIYILDRRGNVRVPVDRIVNKSRNNTFYLDDHATLDKSSIVTSDTAGNVLRISFDGRIETVKLIRFTPDHFFDLKDVNADGINDYIFVDDNSLSVFGQDKSEILNFSFPNEILQPPIYFNFSYADRKLGIVDSRDRQIYLINGDGTLYKGFPLEGSTLFSIGYLEGPRGEFNLIVGGRNNFLYNYTVQ